MKKISDEMKLFQKLLKGIAAQFGDNCEVVLHDYEQGYDRTIVAIENNHVTRRNVGDCGTNLGLEVLRGTVRDGDQYNYITQTKDGKVLRSTSIYIQDKEGKSIGALCINWDITDFIISENTLKTITNSGHSGDGHSTQEVMTGSVTELLDELIQQSISYVGKPVASMNKEDKIKGLKFLDEKGAFLIKKAGDKIIKYYDISRFTLYNYLEQGVE